MFETGNKESYRKIGFFCCLRESFRKFRERRSAGCENAEKWQVTEKFSCRKRRKGCFQKKFLKTAGYTEENVYLLLDVYIFFASCIMVLSEGM